MCIHKMYGTYESLRITYIPTVFIGMSDLLYFKIRFLNMIYGRCPAGQLPESGRFLGESHDMYVRSLAYHNCSKYGNGKLPSAPSIASDRN